MKRSILSTLFFGAMTLLVSAGAASANTINVEYYTTGVFCNSADCSSTSSTFTTGSGGSSATISYTGQSATTEQSGDIAEAADFGKFSISYSGNAALPYSTWFQLSIYQTAPAGLPFPGQLVGTLSGQIKNSGGLLDFSSPGSVTVGNITYNLTDLVMSPNENGVTERTLTGTITHSHELTATPEPASLALLGTGLAGLVAAVRRRRVTK